MEGVDRKGVFPCFHRESAGDRVYRESSSGDWSYKKFLAFKHATRRGYRGKWRDKEP